MTDLNSVPPPIEATALPEYKDRSAGLIVFGVLTVLMGCLSGLFVPLMLFSQMAAAKAGNAAANPKAMLPAMAIYGILAVVLVWLGVGSMMARRWARALLLVFSWSWLAIGVIMVIAMVFLMPTVLRNASANSPSGHPGLNSSAIVGVMVVMSLVLGVLFIILPAIWIFFYQSRHVKATCETRDAVTRWTDACPLPVLGLCLWLLFSVPWLVSMPIMGHGVMPFFGMFLTGVPGSLFCLFLAAFWVYCAWLLYRLDMRGWWLALVGMVAMMGSMLLTYTRHDFIEVYRLMGYPDAQIEQIQRLGLLTSGNMCWVMLFSTVLFLGYLFFVRKYIPCKEVARSQ